MCLPLRLIRCDNRNDSTGGERLLQEGRHGPGELRLYSTLLRAKGEDVKVVQELLRHANSKITMDVYTQALSPAKREAQGRVASIILPKKGLSAVGLSDSFGQLRPRLNSDK